ncbi:MAG: EamA family transporter, partial [Mucilaginibacter sp.]
ISAVPLVWYRVLIASVSLFLYFNFNRTAFKINRPALIKMIFTGALLGGHWILFFYSIKLSTVSIGLVCLSSITLFTAIFEPLFNKTSISRLEVIAGAFIIVGIVIIFRFETHYTKGIIVGLLSAILASIFPIINTQFIQKYQAPVISFYELCGAFIWISLYLLFTGGFNKTMIIRNSDIGYLVILGTICTSLAYVAGVSVMSELSAFRVALITNLEPVYGIILSFVFFGDMNKMSLGFWIGAAIILSTIFLFPVTQRHLIRRKYR